MAQHTDDDRKSMMSQSSTLTSGSSQGDAFSKLDIAIFSIFYPLYDQKKNPRKDVEAVIWGIQLLQLFSLAFFCIDTSTNELTPISYYLNFIDFTTLSFLPGTKISFVVFAFFGLDLLLALYLGLCAGFSTLIFSTQPWIIRVLRLVVKIIYSVLYIPLITMAITMFDCYVNSSGVNVLRYTNSGCLTGWSAVVGFIVSVIHLVFMLATSAFFNLLLYNHNEKKGGWFASPDGKWQALRSTMIFGLIFAMRMLWDWPFWRGFVTVGTSLFLCIYFVHLQPCYNFIGNFLNALPFAMFGGLRLFLEIGIAITVASDSIVPTIVFAVLGFAAGIGLIIVCFRYGKKREKAIWMLDPKGHPLFDYHSGGNNLSSNSGYYTGSSSSSSSSSSSASSNMVTPRSQGVGGYSLHDKGMNPLVNIGGMNNSGQMSSSLSDPIPNIKNPEKVEPSLRFLTNYKYRTSDHLQFADAMYTHAIRKNRNNAYLNFNYANFLETFRKNVMKAQTVYRQARLSSPPFFLRFTLYCKTKETNNQGGMGGSELNSLNFASLFSKATDQHRNARDSLKDLLDNITLIKPNFNLLPKHLHQVVIYEAQARKNYEELISSHPKNTAVLRSYARLLLDIYEDEDTASIILAKADQLEEDSTISITGAAVTAHIADHHGRIGAKAGEIDGLKKDEASKLDAMFDQMKMPDNHSGAKSSVTENKNVDGSANNDNNNNNNNLLSGEADNKPSVISNEPSTSTSNPALLSPDNPSQTEGGLTPIKPVTVLSSSNPEVIQPETGNGETSPADIYAIEESMIEERKERMRQQIEKASHASGASVAKKKKKKKKKGKHGESLITDLTGGGSETDTSTMSKIITVFLILLHFTYIIALVVGLIIYCNITTDYSIELESLERVCRVVTSTARLSNTVLQFMIHDLRFDFQWDRSDNNVYYKDGNENNKSESNIYHWETTLMPLDVVINLLQVEADSLSSIAHDIYDLTSKLDTWISQSVRVCKYTMGKIQRTNINGRVREVPSFERLEISRVSLVSCLDSLATMSKIMSETDVSKHQSPEYEQYFDDVMFVVVNGPQSAMDGAKKAILSFMDESDEQNNTSVLYYSVIVGSVGGLVILTLILIYVYFIVKVSHNRTDAYYSLLDIPKQKLQSVIRRLIDAEKDENEESTLTHTMTESMTESEGMGFDGDVHSQYEGSIRDEDNYHDNNNNNNNNRGSGTPNSQQPLLSNQNMDQGGDGSGNMSPQLGDLNNIVPPNGGFLGGPSILPPTPVGNTVPTLSPQMNMGLFNNMQPMGLQNNLPLTQGMMNSSILDQPSLLGNNLQNNLLQSNMSVASNAPLLQNPLFQGQVNGNMTNMNTMGLNNNISTTSPQNAAAGTTNPADNNNNNNKDNKDNKDKDKDKLDNNYLDDEMDEQQIEAMNGYIRGAVEDAQWEEKIESDIQKHTASYSQLPNPIEPLIIGYVVISIGVMVGIIVAIIVIIIVTVSTTKLTARNIILSGMRVSVLMQMKFILLRICYTMEYLMPDQRADFSEVTNPVWKDDTHLSSDKTYLLSLLQKMSSYFQALHSDCHYGDSDYAVTNDSVFDSVSVTRLPVDQNSNILLKPAECYSSSGEDCGSLDPYRVYGIYPPIYGLSTLIARFRLGILRLSTWNAETIDEFTDEIRFISTAIYKDLQEGVSMLTADILQKGKNDISSAQNLLIGLTAGLSVLVLVILIFVSLQWRNKVTQIELESRKLVQLLPKTDIETEMQMLPSMKTGEAKMDKGRELILDSGAQLYEASIAHESLEVVMSSHKQLMQYTYKEFTDEEELMKKTNYDPELMEKHKQSHLLIRQRLTMIGDYLKQQSRSSTVIALRYLLSLFDAHFTDEDIQFGASLVQEEEEEKLLQQEGSQMGDD